MTDAEQGFEKWCEILELKPNRNGYTHAVRCGESTRYYKSEEEAKAAFAIASQAYQEGHSEARIYKMPHFEVPKIKSIFGIPVQPIAAEEV